MHLLVVEQQMMTSKLSPFGEMSFVDFFTQSFSIATSLFNSAVYIYTHVTLTG